MPDTEVEQAVKENCQALLIGDLMRVMNDLTPEAMAQVMSGGGNMGAMPALRSFDIQSHDVEGDDHVFKIKFEGDQDFVVRVGHEPGSIAITPSAKGPTRKPSFRHERICARLSRYAAPDLSSGAALTPIARSDSH